jgi:post-segregation antitoxin (ccd killing protein)
LTVPSGITAGSPTVSTWGGEALALEVHRRLRETWLEENREAIETYNELVAQHGVFSTGLRGF